MLFSICISDAAGWSLHKKNGVKAPLESRVLFGGEGVGLQSQK